MMQAVERGKQNFVTKFNHDQHLSWGLYYMSIPNRLPPARSQGALSAKVWLDVYNRILPCLSQSWP